MLRTIFLVTVAMSFEPFSDDELENLCGAPALSYAFFACRELCLRKMLETGCEQSLSGKWKKYT